MMGLTEKQATAKAFIADYIASNGFVPSYDEIKSHCGLASKSGVARLIDILEARGHVRRPYGKWRALELVDSKAPPRSPLTDYSTAELLAELQRRANR